MKKIIIFIILFISLILFDMFYFEVNTYKINEETIQIDNLPDSFNNFKIVQISDTLISDNSDIDKLKDIVNKINDYEVDIIVFTGDLIDKEYNISDEEISSLKEILNSLECSLYKYAVIGDNDIEKLDTYKSILDSSNFKLLNNESVYLFNNDITPIKITGLTNLNDVDNSLSIIDNLNTIFNLVLTHYPDYFSELKNKDVDVIFSGHSLLGKIRIPFYGGIIKQDSTNKYLNDYYEENNTKMYVSSGIGTNNLKVRFNNKPEINIYVLSK